MREFERRWRERNPEKVRAARRRGGAREAQRLREDSEYHARRLQMNREAYRARRLSRGEGVREREYLGVSNAVVPIGPFREWLRVVVDLEPEYERIGGKRLAADGREALAGRLGTTDRTIYRLLNEGQPWVSVRLADRAVHGYDRVVEVGGKQIVMFDDLYGPLVPLEVRPSDARKIFGDSFSGEVLP